MAGTSRANVIPTLTIVLVNRLLILFPVDYNSWVESDTGRKLADSLDKDVVLAEGMSPSATKAKMTSRLLCHQDTRSTTPSENTL